MFRRLLLPRACLTFALGAAVLTAPLAARGQDGATEERLDRLERDLNMLQRQVYRGGPPSADGGGGEAVNVEVRMERLEQQMRDLTGRLEEVMNRIERVRQRVEQINGDVDMRLGQAAGAPGPAAAGRPAPDYPPAPPGQGDDGLMPPRQLAGPAPPGAAPDQGGAGGPTPIFGTLTPPGARPPPQPPAALASAAPSGRAPASGALPDGSAAEQYNYAFGLLKKADYAAAEGALKAFIERHPRDQMAGNAQFWLGETYYTRGLYLQAASAFAEGYKRYPKSPKAPDGLLKLGMSLGHANQKQNACLALAELDHDFPHASGAIKERAAAERRHLGC